MSADVYGLVLDDHVSDLVLDGHCVVNLVFKEHVNVPVSYGCSVVDLVLKDHIMLRWLPYCTHRWSRPSLTVCEETSTPRLDP